MEVSYGIAFVAGLVSFLAPCVLPLMPGYLAYLAGTTVADSASHRRQVFINSLCFVLGFSLVFSIVGLLLHTALADVSYVAHVWLARAGGAIIVLFGVYLLGFFRVPFLEREHRPSPAALRSRYLTSLLFGAAFAVGWSPCVGAVLGAILGLAAAQPSSAFGLLLAYSLGLSLPFLALGAFTSQAARVVRRMGPYLRWANVAFGAILIAFGVLVFTQNIGRVSNWGLVNQCVQGMR